MVEPVSRIGTAGWAIPASHSDSFPGEGSSLERYSARFDCVEINSSFHRSHRTDTWRRWASSVPEGFVFSVKLSKEITHKRRLVDCAEPLAAALAEMNELGERLGILLVQLPPSLAFEPEVADAFLTALRAAPLELVRARGRFAACRPPYRPSRGRSGESPGGGRARRLAGPCISPASRFPGDVPVELRRRPARSLCPAPIRRAGPNLVHLRRHGLARRDGGCAQAEGPDVALPVVESGLKRARSRRG